MVTCEALGVVGVAQGSDHSSLHVLGADPALGAVENMVVLAAVVLLILHEVPASQELSSAHLRGLAGGSGDTMEGK